MCMQFWEAQGNQWLLRVCLEQWAGDGGEDNGILGNVETILKYVRRSLYWEYGAIYGGWQREWSPHLVNSNIQLAARRNSE